MWVRTSQGGSLYPHEGQENVKLTEVSSAISDVITILLILYTSTYFIPQWIYPGKTHQPLTLSYIRDYYAGEAELL